MVRWAVLTVLFWVLVPAVVPAAEVHRCRDEQGRLFVTDDPGKFPPGCVPVTEPGDGGALSVLPMAEPEPAARNNAEAAAERERAERAERQARIASWKSEARDLAALYQEAETRRNQAYRRWSYSSREVVQESLAQMEEARTGKESLLREMDRVFIPGPDREEIHRILEAIPPASGS
ncbi:DUF4124 domain-containing protein [Geoalkalibacter halelectricus]|uniref:DUF4124 domain-containing protein n=1 Tax=Geoalkalibacter halelectricus TaxID=2847045 RepID=A0ABY5ZFU3_9BACT|nr:DUF4124 domain-containing protein [Geoalkalibacter halelectricus]MDO3377889.1 DUF4124 domain-containing protein [Geoalkalibacter halelectricus]UWZ77928.1 DUF4124 domain-containing protein [Geoalkalibacter halelectricus]